MNKIQLHVENSASCHFWTYRLAWLGQWFVCSRVVHTLSGMLRARCRSVPAHHRCPALRTCAGSPPFRISTRASNGRWLTVQTLLWTSSLLRTSASDCICTSDRYQSFLLHSVSITDSYFVCLLDSCNYLFFRVQTQWIILNEYISTVACCMSVCIYFSGIIWPTVYHH